MEVSIAVAVAMIFLGSLLFREEIWAWLKGSRVTYFIPNKTVLERSWCSTSLKLRNFYQRRVLRETAGINTSVVEISLGLFRRGAIYGGPASKSWRIVGVTKAGKVLLTDNIGVIPEMAVQVINWYGSLQAVFDRVQELEGQLHDANNRRLEWRAAVMAILQVIEADKQKYRSQAAKNIHDCLVELSAQAQFMREPQPTEKKILAWREVFEKTISGIAD